MQTKTLEIILKEQQKYVSKILSAEYHIRNFVNNIDFNLSKQIIQGVRNSGKTFATLNHLHKSGISFTYIDLSERTLSKLCKEDLLKLVEATFTTSNRCRFVVIDEFICNHNWEILFNSFVENGVNVIGICSGIFNFDKDVSAITVYPLSFSEYCVWHDVKADTKTVEGKALLRRAFDDYIFRGGFPVLQDKTRIKSASAKIVNSIVENDIRGDVRKSMLSKVQEIARYLLANSASLVNYKTLAERFEMNSEITLKKYVEAIKSSGSLYGLRRFAMFDKVRNIYEKLYAVDPVLVGSEDYSLRLETVIFLHLSRICLENGIVMHYYANRNAECDFAMCIDMKMRMIIQVMADYSDRDSIKEKVSGLVSMSKATGCTKLLILTYDTRDTLEAKGMEISVIPACDFLLNNAVDLDRKSLLE